MWQVVLLAALAVSPVRAASGDEVTVVGDASDAQDVHAWVLEDPGGRLTIDGVRGPAALAFRPLVAGGENVGFTASIYWMRLRLRNEGRSSSFFLSPDGNQARVELYEDSQPAPSHRSGFLVPTSERDVADDSLVLRVTLAPGTERELWVRISPGDTLVLEPRIWSEAAFWQGMTRERLRDGLYYGLLLGLVAYNLFLFLFTGDKSYAWYVAFQSAMALTLAAIDKYTLMFLWPSHPEWAARSEQVFATLAMVAALGFARRFLDTPVRMPRLDRGLLAMSFAGLVVSIISAVTAHTALKLAAGAVCLGGVTLIGVVAVRAAWRGQANARVFILAWGVLLVGVMLLVLHGLGVFATTEGIPFTKLGSGLEAVLLSVALANRINALTRERERAQRELLASKSARVEALSRLISGVAHEVGNPLNFARGGADELAERLDVLQAAAGPELVSRIEPVRRAQRLIGSGLDRIRTLLENLRAYIQTRDVERVPTDLNGELEQALELSREWLQRSGVRVEKVLANLPSIPARPGELHQVLVNLIVNAAQAMPEGGSLRVETRETEGIITVSVEDTGPGVDPANREAIFEPFFTTRASAGGTGLGLAVAREIVLRHGGQIRVEDRAAGPGARFVVSLPKPVGN